MLDIIENDLLRKHLPNVSYLRLDGSVPANMRHEIVAKFNNDPSIDILLLTTQVSDAREALEEIEFKFFFFLALIRLEDLA